MSEKPTATLTCSNRVVLNEGEDFSCKCEAKGGNPPGNVTWYKNRRQFGNGDSMLTLTGANKNDTANYVCVAQSYTLKDETTVEVTVFCKYK